MSRARFTRLAADQGAVAPATAVMLAVRNQPWIDLVALGVTVLVTHLGLLFWELRYVSASLAYPALKPGHKEAVQP